MERRKHLKLLLAAIGSFGSTIVLAQTPPANPSLEHSIELHVDLSVDPAREQEMLDIFHKTFKPAASKQPGYINMKILKLTSTLRGPAPPDSNYRFVLTFASDELRQRWVATPTHKALWPTIEACLRSNNYSRLLYRDT